MRCLRLILPVLTGLVLLSFLSGCLSNANTPAETTHGIEVEIQRIHPVENSQMYNYSGTIKEAKTIPAAFPVSGIVENVYVREGQAVKQGQLLATLETEIFENSFSMAEASYQQACDAVSRLQPMHDNGNLPDIKMVEAETGLKQTKAAMELSKKNLDDCKLTARDHGIIGSRSIDPGSGAMPGMAAFTIVQIDQVYAEISIHESEISSLKLGIPALITVPALGDRHWEGVIDEIGVIADPMSRTYKVRVLVPNKDSLIRPGMICNVIIDNEINEKVLAVPIEAVSVDENGKSFIYTVDPTAKRAKKQVIDLGILLNDGIAMTGGLKENDIVVVAGQHKLYENAPLRINNKDALEVQ